MANKTAQWLSDLTHLETPWKEARKGLIPGERGASEISLSTMLEYYSGVDNDDLDQLFSLRLTVRKRVWGIKEGNIFWILWWDPEHEVCKSHKKHT